MATSVCLRKKEVRRQGILACGEVKKRGKMKKKRGEKRKLNDYTYMIPFKY